VGLRVEGSTLNTLQEAKIKTIEKLIQACLNDEDLGNYKRELSYLQYADIAMYARIRHLKYSLDDIGRSQKTDLICSIVKHNRR
jgi:hypothetical protein